MPSPQETDGIRLQKVLAAAGVGSRRACEALIDQGRVEVDGRVIRGQGVRVDPATVVVRVDGERIPTAPGLVTFALNKPVGVVSTMHDDRGRPSLEQYVAGRKERLFHIGRLDTDTSGLLLMTNDGQLAQRLAHPSHEIAKTYVATVRGKVTRDTIRTLRTGVELDDGPVRCDQARLISEAEGRSMIEVALHEGRNRIVRRMMDAVGHPVLELVRTQLGPIRLGQQRSGTLRPIIGTELGALYEDADRQ
jgi:23S rRNA pseudouridine2605 synthase